MSNNAASHPLIGAPASESSPVRSSAPSVSVSPSHFPSPVVRKMGLYTSDEIEGTVRFIMPKFRGLPVDYCLRYQHGRVHRERRGIDCGVPAASQYCRDQGMDDSIDYVVTYYSSQATSTLGDGAVHAADPAGDGKGRHTWFTSITCRFSVREDVAVAEAGGWPVEEISTRWEAVDVKSTAAGRSMEGHSD